LKNVALNILMKSITHEKRRFWLTFAPKRTTKPLILEIIRKCDLRFSIRNSSDFTDSMGVLAVEFEGTPETIERAMRGFKRKGVRVDPIELNTIEG
jgi:ABC-type methionine transport system ATPase subunit